MPELDSPFELCHTKIWSCPSRPWSFSVLFYPFTLDPGGSIRIYWLRNYRTGTYFHIGSGHIKKESRAPLVFVEIHQRSDFWANFQALHRWLLKSDSDRTLPPCNSCHHPWCVGDKSYHKALLIMFSCDGMSDYTSWNDVFHYWDTKLSCLGGRNLLPCNMTQGRSNQGGLLVLAWCDSLGWLLLIRLTLHAGHATKAYIN